MRQHFPVLREHLQVHVTQIFNFIRHFYSLFWENRDILVWQPLILAKKFADLLGMSTLQIARKL